MNKEEYKIRKNKLKDQYDADKRVLDIEYVNKNNSHKKGDIITDHVGSIKLINLSLAYESFTFMPCATYKGYELKKNLEPKKNGAIRVIWQSNIIN